MGVAKRGDQEVRAEDVSSKCTETTGLPGLGFTGNAKTAPRADEGGSRREKAQLAGSKDVGWETTKREIRS